MLLREIRGVRKDSSRSESRLLTADATVWHCVAALGNASRFGHRDEQFEVFERELHRPIVRLNPL